MSPDFFVTYIPGCSGTCPTEANNMNTTSHSLPARFARALGTIASGVPNPWDESDDYFRPFSVELPSDAVLDDATLRAALKVSSRYRLDVTSVDLDEVAGEAENELAASYHLLGTVMNATLTEIHRINARAPGVVRVRLWLVGRFQSRWLVGLRTTST